MLCCTLPMLCCLLTEIEGRKEGSDLLNDGLNTLYLQLYGVRHMVKYH